MYYSKKRKIKKNNTGRYKNKPLLSEDNDEKKCLSNFISIEKKY